MNQSQRSTESCHKYQHFLFQRCDSMLISPEIKLTDYEPFKREYNDFLDRMLKSTDFEKHIKENIVR